MSNFNQYGEHQILLKFAQNYMNDKIKVIKIKIKNVKILISL